MFARYIPRMKPLKWETELARERIHINYAYPFEGKYVLTVVDS